MDLWNYFQNNTGKKITKWKHYFPVYEKHFGPIRNKPIKILVIDSDLEAPGLTYWQRYENQEATVSLSNFLEVYQYPKPSLEVALSWVTQEIKKTAKQQNKSTLYFLA